MVKLMFNVVLKYGNVSLSTPTANLLIGGGHVIGANPAFSCLRETADFAQVERPDGTHGIQACVVGRKGTSRWRVSARLRCQPWAEYDPGPISNSLSQNLRRMNSKYRLLSVSNHHPFTKSPRFVTKHRTVSLSFEYLEGPM